MFDFDELREWDEGLSQLEQLDDQQDQEEVE